ncbi:hypothetical protein OGATHE_003777 [Ogataea polymorpha]|uniref:Sm domain-containing protein n=1 Tax=Ogataea polymorpha TaxID=460523 RepID=A0A9P8P4V4_9ASCO|nr:hypothetical protein OGATHE_003777 [Ogataea polymorpha]
MIVSNSTSSSSTGSRVSISLSACSRRLFHSSKYARLSLPITSPMVTCPTSAACPPRTFNLISLPYQIVLVDNRQLDGILMAIDDQRNLLLSDVYEHSGSQTRHLGLVSVPKNTIKSVLVDKNEYAKAQRYRERQS